MKVFILSVLLVACLASTPLEQYQTGESCEKSPKFNISSVTIDPFPPGNSDQYTVVMTGIFLSKETVEQIYIGQRKNKENWHYTYQSINKEYPKGTTETYTISLQAPAIKGAYTDQITLHKSDFTTLSCWQYNYVI